MALAPGAAGELAQGVVDGRHVHVSAPIDRFARAVFVRSESPLTGPPDCPKALAAVRAYLSERGRPLTGRLLIASDLPRGKGMASSTADIGAAIGAVAAAYGDPISALSVSRLALTIEPTDGSLLPGVALFDHRQGSVAETLGPAPPLAVAIFDPGGAVDTIAYNAVDRRAALEAVSATIRDAIAMIRAGVAAGDPIIVARAATMSAFAHQTIAPKPALEPVWREARDVGAIGVCVGHSGVIIGALFDARAADVTAALTRLRARVPGRWIAAHLIDGGLRRVGRPQR
ncbi:MAG: hypothetical protein NZ518_06755 [Dehalococcoidia bacterium]|nr:hypothetical protein [Dehalococcoidia bacterium]